MNIQFEQRVVAFIDVLGFKAAVTKGECNEKDRQRLSKIVTLLEEAVYGLDDGVSKEVPEKLIPKHISISDSIILSAPVGVDEHPRYDGLSIIVMRCIQLAQLFLEEGFLLRGAIAVGNVHHTNTNVIGTAYQCAYLEETKVRHPCIVLHQTAAELWPAGKYSKMCIHEEGRYYRVNTLHDWYFKNKGERGGIENQYEVFQTIVDKNISDGHDSRALKKWEKFNEYLQKAKEEAVPIIHATSNSTDTA